MKNIYYIQSEKRYVGRKQIKNKIITVHAKTQIECKKRLTEEIKIFANNLITKKKGITFKEYADKWYLQDKEPFVSERTKEDIKSVLKAMSPIFNINITQLNKDKIIGYLNTLKQSRTKEKVILYLKAILKNAQANNVIKQNPFINIVTAPRIKKKKEALTYEEQITVLDKLKNKKLRIPILIYLTTGLRKNEFNFKSIENDIDLETKTLKAINLKGRNKITRYKRIRLNNNLINLIINNLDIIKSYDAESCYREFYKFMKELKIKKSIVNLRHTFATNHLYLGTPDYVISKEMGHSTSQITKDNYMDIDYHLSKDKIVKLYNNLYTLFD